MGGMGQGDGVGLLGWGGVGDVVHSLLFRILLVVMKVQCKL